MIAVGGGAWPVGQERRNEPAGIPGADTTVKFTEIAAVSAGMPQIPVRSQVRWALFPKMPPVIGAPPRVSATRQGWIATNGCAKLMSFMVVSPPRDDSAR